MAEKPNPMGSAVRALRLALKETQEQFARRIHTTLRTVARYEAGAPPNSKVLAQLERLALELEVMDAAITFREALWSDLGITYFSGEQEIVFSTQDERTITAAILLLRRKGDPSYSYNEKGPAKYRNAWKIVREAIQEPLRELQYGYEKIDRGTRAVRRVAEGDSLVEVASQSGIPEAKLRALYASFQQAWLDLAGRTDEEKYKRLERVLKLLAQGQPDAEVAQRFLGFNYELASKLLALYREMVRAIPDAERKRGKS